MLIDTITDENIGEKEVHVEKYRTRRASRGIVLREDGKIAVFNKANKNEYKLPGGGIEGDEEPEKAFLREALEETGCEVEIIEFLGTIEEIKTQESFKQISYIYVSKVINDTKQLHVTQKEKDEGARLTWETPENALKLIKGSFDNLVASKYESVYHTKFIVCRDTRILTEYMKKRDVN